MQWLCDKHTTTFQPNLLDVFRYAVAMWQTHHNTSTVFELCSGYVTNTPQHFIQTWYNPGCFYSLQQLSDKHIISSKLGITLGVFSYVAAMWQTHHNISTKLGTTLGVFSYAVATWQTHRNTSTELYITLWWHTDAYHVFLLCQGFSRIQAYLFL